MSVTDLDDGEFEELVADALEHLWDFSYLGTHPLAELQGVRQRVISNGRSTHIQMGRALNIVLQNAIDNLRLDDDECEVSREKHFYTILYKSYVEGVRNRDVAGSLSIGERTFYRNPEQKHSQE